MVGDAEIVYVLRYFHGGIFKTSPKFEYENGMMERFQVDPVKLCLWDILDNVKLLGYGHHPFVYYRVPTNEFNCDGLVLIHNDDTIRQVINLLIKKGSVDIYVDHKIDTGEGCPKINEMVEGSKGIMLEDAKEHSDSEKGVDVGGDELGADVDALEAAGEDLRAVIEELHADFQEVMVVVNEGISPSADEGFLPVTGEVFEPNAAQRLETNGGERFETNDAQGSLLLKDVCEDLRIEVDEESTNEMNEDDDHHCFLYDVELLSDLDDEVLSIRTKLIDKEKKRNCSESNNVGLYVSNNNSDEEYGQNIEMEDYALEEYEVKGRDGKVEGHESDYLDSSDPGEYGDSDESAEEICGTYSGKKTLGPRYDIKCDIPTWEVGLRFEDNIQFKEAIKKYLVANGGHMQPTTCVEELERRFSLQGSYVEEFANLWGYAAELLRSNPGSTVSIQVDKENGGALDGVGSGEGDFREVEEPVKSFERNVAAYHTSPVHEKLGGDLDIGSDLGRGLEARPCRNYTPLSGLASNGVERVAETIFAVKLDPKENMGGDVNRQKKSCAERINKNVNLGFSNARDPIEEDNSEDESGREIFTDLERPWGIARNLVEFDSLVCDCLSFRFQFADLMKSSLAALLAQDGFNRNDSHSSSIAAKLRMSPTIQQKKALQIKKRAQFSQLLLILLVFNLMTKRKGPIGIGLYTDLQTGEQILNPGMSSERVVTVHVSVPRKIGAHTSQFQHSWKGPGLSWKGKKAVTTRQLQQENSNASRKHKIIKTQ
ncbi:hypothetical protein V6N11_037046 [Hibiscus sabdariffa]|uniref:PB1-like domain-containing protein n=1 Tax=Hibiscus sabdariffa TaxID=183260 RepID=A0ABR2A967_9ROSI